MTHRHLRLGLFAVCTALLGCSSAGSGKGSKASPEDATGGTDTSGDNTIVFMDTYSPPDVPGAGQDAVSTDAGGGDTKIDPDTETPDVVEPTDAPIIPDVLAQDGDGPTDVESGDTGPLPDDVSGGDVALDDVTAPDTTVDDVTAPDTTVDDVTAPDTTVDDVTAPDTSVEDVTVDAGGCIPFCAAAWECGPDGCGGQCGTCAAGDTCNTATRVCETPAATPGSYGTTCGLTATCNGSAVNWPACLDAQCTSGICTLGATGFVCTKTCTLKKDLLDYTGAAVPDGIEDPGTPNSDCKGAAADGPYGSMWACVTLSDPSVGTPARLCQPGTTFAPCGGNVDCPSGESCQLYMVNGEYSTRCAAKRAGSLPNGALCNDDPAAGPLAYCSSELCFGIGCVGPCAVNSDCAPFQFCDPDRTIFSNDPTVTVDLCFGKPCDANVNCAGASHCELFGNGEVGEAFALDNLCMANTAGASPLGGVCDGDLDDAVPGPDCGGLCLNSGVCSSLCKADTDCAGGAKSMYCNANEESADLDSTLGDDTLIVYGLCVPYEGSKSACQVTADCPIGEACDFHQVLLPDGSLDGVGACLKPDAVGADIGQLCGGATNVPCKTGLCLDINDTNGLCVPLCGSTADCPQAMQQGASNPNGINSYCRALLWGEGGTLNADDDNVFIPLCEPTSGDDSLEDCSGDFACTDPAEACLAQGIAFGSTGPITMEYRCFETGPATAPFGAGCDTDPLAVPAASATCAEAYCLADEGTNQGYCSHLCATDADCSGAGPDFVCDESTYLERKSGEKLTVKLCRKAVSCIPCTNDSQCTDGYVCGNTGTSLATVDFRCMPACTMDADCAGTDGGSTCKNTRDAQNLPSGKYACTPSFCF